LPVRREARALALGIATAIVGGGCAQIFGFDNTEPYDDDGLRLSWQRKLVGTAVVDEPMDLSTGTAAALIPDAADPSGLRRIPAILEDTDTWFVELPPGERATMLFSLPDDEDFVRMYALPARTINGLVGVLGHPDAEPAPANAQIDLLITLDAGYNGEGLSMYTVGAWSVRGYPEVPPVGVGATAWDPAAIPYASYTTLTGRPLERIRSNDAVYLLRYVGNQLAGTLAAPPFDQQDGVDSITGTMTTVPLDQTLDATFRTTVAGPRYTATNPGVAGLSMSWGLTSTPATPIMNNQGVQLHAGGLLETDTGVVNVTYGNPFPYEPVVGFSTSESRQFSPPGAISPTTLYAGMYSVVTPTPAMELDLPQGLPLLVTLAGTALTADGQVVSYDRTKAFDISFVLDRQACDLYSISVYELVDNGAGTFVYTGRATMSGDAPLFTVPGDLLAAGSFYTLRAQCQLGGLPGLATGDLVPRSWPLHVGYFDSGVFQVGS
jgi:hypothetical protein